MKGKELCVFVIASLWALPALAQAPAGGTPEISVGQRLMAMAPMLALCFFIFYFLVIRPQEKRLRTQQALLNDLKKGDMVVTESGIIARVAGIEKDHILLEVSANTKVKFERERITKRYEKPSSASSQNNKADKK